MPSYQRPHVMTLLARLDEPPERLIVVSGPRQTGKTTLVRQALDQARLEYRYLSIDEPKSDTPSLPFDKNQKSVTLSDKRDAGWLTRVWEEARRDDDRSDRGFVLVLDEIQKIPN